MKTKHAFNVKYIFFATVPPYDSAKKRRNKLLKYRVITASGNTTDYLFDIFDKSRNDCKVEIMFKSDQSQNNTIRSLLIELASTPDITKKEKYFEELTLKMYEITDERNGMGLFVLIEGQKDKETRLMLCRFKGAQGLHNEGNDLKYISQVFTKQNNHYKLAVFQDIFSKKSFWTGYAIDRQTASNNYKPFSHFWIEDFLQAETAITNAQGTSQFSKILKNVLNKTKNIKEKEQIISAVVNLKSKPAQKISIKIFSDLYLTGDVHTRFEEQTNNELFYHSEFEIDKEVFQKELGNTVLDLEDGITAFIPTFNYPSHVTEEDLPQGLTGITIRGTLKDKRINVQKEKKEKDNTKENKK